MRYPEEIRVNEKRNLLVQPLHHISVTATRCKKLFPPLVSDARVQIAGTYLERKTELQLFEHVTSHKTSLEDDLTEFPKVI